MVFTLSSLGILLALVFWISRVDPPRIDLFVTLFLQSQRAPWLDALMRAVSLFGWYPWSVLTVLIACVLAGWRISIRSGLYLAMITSLQALLNTFLKLWLVRPRPDDPLVWAFKYERSYSFPSGHVMFYTVFFGFLLFLVWRYMNRGVWRSIFFLILGSLILLVGPSRIYLGAHWLTDVVAGYLVGLVFLGWAIEVYPTKGVGDAEALT